MELANDVEMSDPSVAVSLVSILSVSFDGMYHQVYPMRDVLSLYPGAVTESPWRAFER
jgi:hypothetical protein